MTSNSDKFLQLALPYSNWGESYFSLRMFEYRLIDSLFGDIFSKGSGAICDVGCGLGYSCSYFSDFFDVVEGTDIEDLGVAFNVQEPSPVIGQRIFNEIGLDKVSLSCGDTHEFLAAREKKFDFIFSHFVMEHVEDIETLCKDIFAATKPGGKSLHIVPNTHDTIIQLLKKNLTPLPGNLKRTVRTCLTKGRADGKLNGNLFTPITHSEFLPNYTDQFEVNRLERYVRPLMDAGFKVRDIKPVREHSYGILCEC